MLQAEADDEPLEAKASRHGEQAIAATSSDDTWSWEENAAEDTLGVLRLGVPIFVGASSKIIQFMLISALLGRRDTLLLAATATSMVWTSWMDDAVKAVEGQTSVLSAQAAGAGNKRLVGTWLAIALVFYTIMYVPFCGLRMYTGSFLALIGVDSALAERAGVYASWAAYGMIFECYYSMLQGFLAAQGIPEPDAILSVVFIFVATSFIWIGVYQYDMGIYGVAVALTIKRFLRLACMVGICMWQGYLKEALLGWTWKEVFRTDRWQLFLSLCLPAIVGGIAEQLNMAINAALAARLGPVVAAAFDLACTLYVFMIVLNWSMCTGVGILMAQRLGQGQPERARGMMKVGAVLIYSIVICMSVCFFFCIGVYAEFVSTDRAVIAELQEQRLVMAIGMFVTGGVMLISELLVKMGKVRVVMFYQPLFNWLIALPISFFMAPIWGLSGIFLGSNFSYALSQCVLGYHLLTADWQVIAAEARENAAITGHDADDEKREAKAQSMQEK